MDCDGNTIHRVLTPFQHSLCNNNNRVERKCLGTGCHQLLPYRDRSGRRIFVGVGNFATEFPLEVRVSETIISRVATMEHSLKLAARFVPLV